MATVDSIRARSTSRRSASESAGAEIFAHIRPQVWVSPQMEEKLKTLRKGQTSGVNRSLRECARLTAAMANHQARPSQLTAAHYASFR
jgi:hypothetical protein